MNIRPGLVNVLNLPFFSDFFVVAPPVGGLVGLLPMDLIEIDDGFPWSLKLSPK